MPTLFEKAQNPAKIPLAERLRPQNIGEILGQEHILGKEGGIGKMIAAKRLHSLILWGPPGSGKTTLARLLAEQSKQHFEPCSAVFSGVADLRKIFAAAQERHALGGGSVLFVDEIHRFNRAQQDCFLPHIEEGVITLIGATTENPSFELNNALLSRVQIWVLQRLHEGALEALLKRAEKLLEKKLPLDKKARKQLIHIADGDGRYLLNMAEELFALKEDKTLSTEQLSNILSQKMPLYDKGQEEHYNLISALHKSIRGSDPDAALYWLARMLEGGEDPNYILRRLVRMASEDIGLADPQALPQALAAQQSYHLLGSPEGELALAQAVIYLALAPKSNAAYMAYKASRKAAAEHGALSPPAHILNAPTKLMKELGYGKGYIYDHDVHNAISGQNYFPDAIKGEQFYVPQKRGFERELKKRLEWFAKVRKEQ